MDTGIAGQPGTLTPPARRARHTGSHGTSSSRRWARGLFLVFLLTTLVAPAAGINKLPFALIFAWMLSDALSWPGRAPFPGVAPGAICAIFFYGFSLSLTTESDHAIAFQFLTSVSILFMVNFVLRHGIDMDRASELASLVLIVGTVLFWASIFMPELPYAATIYHFFLDYNFSAASDRDFFDGGATFTLQLGTAPFLFVGFCIVAMRLLSAGRRRFDLPWLLLLYVTILTSGLRALIAIATLFLATLLVLRMQRLMRFITLFAVAAAAASVWLFVLRDSMVFSTEEVSNSVKIGHFTSFVDGLSFASAVFGRGLANFYYSTGSSALKAYTELTPIDLMRYFGIPLTLVVYFLLAFPVRGARYFAGPHLGPTLAFALYLLMSMTNPVMFNSYGMIVVVWYWSTILRPSEPPARAR